MQCPRYNRPVQRILAIYDQRRMIGHVTMAPTLFQAVANALNWWEVACRQFGTARRLPDDTVLDIVWRRFSLFTQGNRGVVLLEQ